MDLANNQNYTITEHARDRIYSRFNITKTEFDAWTARLLSQAVFVEKRGINREKYRLNDVVMIVDTKQKCVVTVYSENEHDDIKVSNPTNPEIKSVMNSALRDFEKQKKVRVAKKMHDSLQKALEANQRMIKPYTNYRYSDMAWTDLVRNFNQAKEELEKGIAILEEAELKIGEK